MVTGLPIIRLFILRHPCTPKNRHLVDFIGHQNYWASYFYYHNHRRDLLEHYWAVCSVFRENRLLLLVSTRQCASSCCKGYNGCLEIFFRWPSYFIWSVASSVHGLKSTRLLHTGIPQRSSVFISYGDSWVLEGEYSVWNWQNSVSDAARRHIKHTQACNKDAGGQFEHLL